MTDMTKVIEDLKTLKNAIDEQRNEKAKLEGRLESYLATLTEKYGLTEETAPARLAELNTQMEDLRGKIERLHTKITTEYDF